MREPAYPFIPKSTRSLKRGQFWSIPLEDGRYGAGCVVGELLVEGKPSSRTFIAGVIRWIGNQVPTAADLAGRPVMEFAFAHLKVITAHGGDVIGIAEIAYADEPYSAQSLSLPTWGYIFPKLLAERIEATVG